MKCIEILKMIKLYSSRWNSNARWVDDTEDWADNITVEGQWLQKRRWKFDKGKHAVSPNPVLVRYNCSCYPFPCISLLWEQPSVPLRMKTCSWELANIQTAQPGVQSVANLHRRQIVVKESRSKFKILILIQVLFFLLLSVWSNRKELKHLSFSPSKSVVMDLWHMRWMLPLKGHYIVGHILSLLLLWQTTTYASNQQPHDERRET